MHSWVDGELPSAVLNYSKKVADDTTIVIPIPHGSL